VELFHWSLIALFGLSLVLIVLSFAIHIPERQFQFRWLFGSGIFILLFSLAYFLCGEQEKSNGFDHLHQKGIYQVELTSAPVEKSKSFMCKADVLQFFDASWKPAYGHAILYFQKDKNTSRLLYGDRLMVEAEFVPPERQGNPDGFDYAAYLKRQGIRATAYISSQSWQFSGRNEAFSIRRSADKCRNYLLNIYRKFNIQGDEFAVLAALTLGYTDDLNPDLRSSYSASGVMHILSVSGMHVGVIYMVLAFLLGFLNKTQRQKVFKMLFIMMFLWAYAFVTGLSAAVIRATLMFTFVAFATCFQRKSQIYNTIFMSIMVMLLYNPNFLYDVGFQLSYSAVLSIIFFLPIVNKLYHPENKFTKYTWDMVAVSIAAQLGTTPFTLYYFQQFPNYFLVTNFIAIPLSSLIIYLAMALLMVSFIPYLSVAVGFILKESLWLLNFFIVWIQNLPYSVTHISIDIRQTFVIFLCIFCLSEYYFSRKFIPLFIGLFSLLLACLFSLETSYHTLTTSRMIVFGDPKSTHVNFINRNQNYVFTTDSTEMMKIAKTFWQHQKLSKPIFIMENNWSSKGFVYYEGSRLLILTNDMLKGKTTSTPLELDYLIIGNRLKPKINQLLECVHPRKIIVDKSISGWYTENIRQVCKKNKIDFYSVAEQGAYKLIFKD
jgi:competence protein ComEC